jgi:LacI family transcriptional regulator
MHSRKPASLADVAARAGIDPSTASRVLNGRADQRVSEGTRARILAAAVALDYRPNSLARGLRLSRTRTLGIIVPQLENLLYAEIVAGASQAVRADDYTLLIVHHGEDATDGSAYRRIAEVNRIDGLIIATLTPDLVLATDLRGFETPVVVVHRKIEGIENCITIDSFTAVKRCIEHLIALGHRRIGFLARVTGYYNDTQRLAGYRAALVEAGIPVEEDLIIHTPHTRTEAEQTIRGLLDRDWALPTAIFNVALIASAGIMSVLAERGLHVPDDLSVISLYDNPFAEVLQPPVTTMRMPLQQLGAAGATLLINILEKRPDNDPRMLPPGPIQVRRSTGAPRAD